MKEVGGGVNVKRGVGRAGEPGQFGFDIAGATQ